MTTEKFELVTRPGDVVPGHVHHVADWTGLGRLLGLGFHLSPLVVHQLLALEKLVQFVVFEGHMLDQGVPVGRDEVTALALVVGVIESVDILLQLRSGHLLNSILLTFYNQGSAQKCVFSTQSQGFGSVLGSLGSSATYLTVVYFVPEVTL